MKKMILLTVVSIALLAFPVLTQATAVIEEIELTQIGGAFATYDPSSGGTATWSGGASGIMKTNTNGLIQLYTYFDPGDAVIEATFTGVNDSSGGGLASASFDTGTFKITLGGPADSDVIIEG